MHKKEKRSFNLWLCYGKGDYQNEIIAEAVVFDKVKVSAAFSLIKKGGF